MGYRFTRRKFLSAVSAGATYLALATAVGCDPRERNSKAKTSTKTKASKSGTSPAAKVRPAQKASSATSGDALVFRSRPDLQPPAVEVTIKAHDQAPGYVFMAPKLGEEQHGPLIIDNHGQPVWFREQKYVLDFKAQRYNGKPVLTWWEGDPLPKPSVGEWVILDGSYREITRVQAGNGYKGNQHDFNITPQGTALLTIYNLMSWDLSPLGGPSEGLVYEGVVQELDIETGKVLFEWHSLDHVGPEESYYKPGRKPLDYFHLNSIEVDHDENLIISARNTSTVYKIDRTTGKVMWRLGGKRSDFEMGEGTRTAWQHDARRQEDGTLTIFDNGAAPKLHEQSRGIVVDLDEDNMTANLVREYTSPHKLVSTSEGDMQVLPNGNVFIGWGSEPFASEFSHDGELLFNAHLLPSRDDSYRAFRFPWKGHPSDAPAVAVERGANNEVTLYVSWNGATEVATWEVLAGPRPDHVEPLGAAPRDGFETALSARTSEPYFAVRAKDSSGQVLGTSKPVKRGS